MAKNQDITAADNWFKTEDKQIAWLITDSAGSPQTMTGWTVSFNMYSAKTSANALVTKTAAISNGDGTDDRAVITVADTDTETLAAGTYVYELVRTDAGSEQVLAYGTALLRTTKEQV